MNKYLPLILIPLLTTSCASSSMKDDFACKSSTDGVRCYPAKEIYKMTNNSSYVKSSDSDDATSNSMKSNIPTDKEIFDEIRSSDVVHLPDSDRPLPVRTNAKVIRVKVFPFEDEKGVFHAGDYLYSEVVGRKWTLTDGNVSKAISYQSRMITPLQQPKN